MAVQQKRLLTLEDLSNFAVCPKLYYAKYEKTLPADNQLILNKLLDLHKFELMNWTVPDILRLETAIKVAFSDNYRHSVKDPELRDKIKGWLPIVRKYYNEIFKNHDIYRTIEYNMEYEFMLNTEMIRARAPVLMANEKGALVLVLFDSTIESLIDITRSVLAKGHALGFSTFYPLSQIWNYNPITGSISKLVLTKDFNKKNLPVLQSVLRAIRMKIDYYGCQKCILGKC